MIVIPAIDIVGGRCVRLHQGDFSRIKSYEADPVDQARAVEAAGITHLHLVDLDGARTGRPANLHILEGIASRTRLQIDFGGGIRHPGNIRDALSAGARKVNAGTLLFDAPETPADLVREFGSDRLIAAVDVRNGQVALRGWQDLAGVPPGSLIERLLSVGWEWISLTDISRDGTMQGPDVDFFTQLAAAFPHARIIGGGGVASPEHLALLKGCGLSAAITGKAVFEGRLSLKDIALFNQTQTDQPC
jgi:phosphoribosylformimino-5-aminoimidazole carboxamide ribotide isomerase